MKAMNRPAARARLSSRVERRIVTDTLKQAGARFRHGLLSAHRFVRRGEDVSQSSCKCEGPELSITLHFRVRPRKHLSV